MVSPSFVLVSSECGRVGHGPQPRGAKPNLRLLSAGSGEEAVGDGIGISDIESDPPIACTGREGSSFPSPTKISHNLVIFTR